MINKNKLALDMAKRYFEYMVEISKDELYKGLLAYGFFADKLPPVFSSEMFYEYCANNDCEKFSKKPRDYIRYSSIRNTNVPRAMGIPSPFLYMQLCVILRDKWNEICALFKDKTQNQDFKRSQLHIQKFKLKESIFEMNHDYMDRDSELETELYGLPIMSRYQVDADISSCFPSIYSHAIAWALVGKDVAKRDRGEKTHFQNEIDRRSRNLKNGETNGLIIGPHTSNLISELILCSVDERLVGKGYKYVRNIDDYRCFVRSEDEAENFIQDLNEALKEYELSLNAKKTKISPLPLAANANWVSRLNEFYIGNTITEDGKQVFELRRLKAYIDLTINLAKENSNLALYTYMIKVVGGCALGDKALKLYFATIRHLVCLYPYLVHWVDKYVFEAFNISRKDIRLIAADVYNEGLRRHVYEACSFSLYWCLKYNISLDVNYSKDSILSNDCIFMTLSFLVAKMQKKEEYIKNLVLKARRLAINDFDQYWLFVYEMLSDSELPEDFNSIKKEGITFIKKEFNFAV